MSLLSVFRVSDPGLCLHTLHQPDAIAAALAGHGVRFRKMPDCAVLAAGAPEADIRAALAGPIAEECAHGGYESVDVVSVTPATPGVAAMRTRFLAEHVHVEDEARLMVAGSGVFYLRVQDTLLLLLLEAGELISVPAGMRHWFDMGLQPAFTAVRFFTRPDGWVAQFTGDPIAASFPDWAGAAAA